METFPLILVENYQIQKENLKKAQDFIAKELSLYNGEALPVELYNNFLKLSGIHLSQDEFVNKNDYTVNPILETESALIFENEEVAFLIGIRKSAVFLAAQSCMQWTNMPVKMALIMPLHNMLKILFISTGLCKLQLDSVD